MFGLILGTLCLVALIATVRRRRYGAYAYGGPGWMGFHRGPWADGYGPPWASYGGARRGLMRGLFAQLDTTPGQEKAIRALLEAARERLKGLRGELADARTELAALFGGDVLEPATVEALFAQRKPVLEQLSGEFARTLAAIHEVLDEKQRRQLSELLADGSLGSALHGGRFYGC